MLVVACSSYLPDPAGWSWEDWASTAQVVAAAWVMVVMVVVAAVVAGFAA